MLHIRHYGQLPSGAEILFDGAPGYGAGGSSGLPGCGQLRIRTSSVGSTRE